MPLWPYLWGSRPLHPTTCMGVVRTAHLSGPKPSDTATFMLCITPRAPAPCFQWFPCFPIFHFMSSNFCYSILAFLELFLASCGSNFFATAQKTRTPYCVWDLHLHAACSLPGQQPNAAARVGGQARQQTQRIAGNNRAVRR